MKIFIGIKYDKESLLLVSKIKEIIKKLGHLPYCFAQDEGYISDEKEMMKKAFQKIDESDLIIIEASQLAFGVGIEAGYSFAKKKKIITIANELEKISNTLKGVSNLYLSYKDFNELEIKLRESL
jgi:nucleoside 2-deoxyribosyltransferase